MNSIQKQEALEHHKLDQLALKDDLKNPSLPKNSKLINAGQITHLCRQVIKVADRMQSLRRQAQEYLKFVRLHPEVKAWKNGKLNTTVSVLRNYSSRDIKLDLGTSVQTKRLRPSTDGREATAPHAVPARLSISEYLERVRLNNVIGEEACKASQPVWYLKKVAIRCIARDDKILDKIRRLHNNYYNVTQIINIMSSYSTLDTPLNMLSPLGGAMKTIEPRLLKSHSTMLNQLGRVFYDKWHKLLYYARFKSRGNDYDLYNYSHFLHNISLDRVGEVSVSDYADYLLYIAPHEKHPVL